MPYANSFAPVVENVTRHRQRRESIFDNQFESLLAQDHISALKYGADKRMTVVTKITNNMFTFKHHNSETNIDTQNKNKSRKVRNAANYDFHFIFYIISLYLRFRNN